jgi:hypothetical protein
MGDFSAEMPWQTEQTPLAYSNPACGSPGSSAALATEAAAKAMARLKSKDRMASFLHSKNVAVTVCLPP